MKNALDYAYKPWVRKPVAYVGYGGVGAARAIEQLRLIAIELQQAPIKTAIHIGGGDFVALMRGEKKIEELTHLNDQVAGLTADLAWWTHALKAARSQA